jgi:hypothetical protein
MQAMHLSISVEQKAQRLGAIEWKKKVRIFIFLMVAHNFSLIQAYW